MTNIARNLYLERIAAKMLNESVPPLSDNDANLPSEDDLISIATAMSGAKKIATGVYELELGDKFLEFGDEQMLELGQALDSARVADEAMGKELCVPQVNKWWNHKLLIMWRQG